MNRIDPRVFDARAIGPFFCAQCHEILRAAKKHFDCIDALDDRGAGLAAEQLPDLITYTYTKRDADGCIDVYTCTRLRTDAPPPHSCGFEDACDDAIIEWLHARGRQFCTTSFANLRKLKPMCAEGRWKLAELLPTSNTTP
jgi:hypothetical protein